MRTRTSGGAGGAGVSPAPTHRFARRTTDRTSALRRIGRPPCDGSDVRLATDRSVRGCWPWGPARGKAVSSVPPVRWTDKERSIIAGMHPTAARLVDRLRDRGLTIEVRTLRESVRTAALAAAALGVDVGQIVNSLVFLRRAVAGAGPMRRRSAGRREAAGPVAGHGRSGPGGHRILDRRDPTSRARPSTGNDDRRVAAPVLDRSGLRPASTTTSSRSRRKA